MSESNGNGVVDNLEDIPEKTLDQLSVNELRMLEYFERTMYDNSPTANFFNDRLTWWNRASDPQRNINKECGYPEAYIALDEYRQLYDRDPIAARVVEVMPLESWQTQPSVYEDENPDNETEFEKTWKTLHRKLHGTAGSPVNGQNSWYQDEEGSQIWSYLLRLDIRAGIGHYGVLLLGIDDGLDLRTPVKGFEDLDSEAYLGTEAQYGPNPYYPFTQGYDEYTKDQIESQYKDKLQEVMQAPVMMPGEALEPGTTRNLIYLRVFDEQLALITRYERDPRNPRFGLPTMYLITFNDPKNDPTSGAGLPVASTHVHWSRVIHFADKLGANETLGYPRMKQCWNRLLDLCKVNGGAGEAYWQQCMSILSFETHPQLGGDVTIDTKSIDQQVAKVRERLKKHLISAGGAWKTLAPDPQDPTPFKDCFVEAICIVLGCPVRVFKGSERGELASSQDDGKWNDRLRHRQQFLLTPKLIVPFIDRLIQMGVLPTPKGYSVKWPDLESVSDSDKAKIALTKTQALGAYVSQNVEAVMTPSFFATRVMGMDHEDAEEMVEGAQQTLDQGYGMTPGQQEEEPQPQMPVKMKAGESLVHPETGQTVGIAPQVGAKEA